LNATSGLISNLNPQPSPYSTRTVFSLECSAGRNPIDFALKTEAGNAGGMIKNESRARNGMQRNRQSQRLTSGKKTATPPNRSPPLTTFFHPFAIFHLHFSTRDNGLLSLSFRLDHSHEESGEYSGAQSVTMSATLFSNSRI